MVTAAKTKKDDDIVMEEQPLKISDEPIEEEVSVTRPGVL